MILPEIAEQYSRPLSTIRTWWIADPAWPEPSGKRGRWLEYDPVAVAAAVEAITARPQLDPGNGNDLLTIAQAAEYAGLQPATIRSDMHRGRWPDPDDEEHGVKRWKRSTVATVMANRRNYRRKEERA